MVNETNNASEMVGEVIEGIPEKLQWYSDVLDIIKGVLFGLLEKLGIDPTDFLFWSLVLLILIITVGKKIVFTKWILVAVAAVVLLAWLL